MPKEQKLDSNDITSSKSELNERITQSTIADLTNDPDFIRAKEKEQEKITTPPLSSTQATKKTASSRMKNNQLARSVSLDSISIPTRRKLGSIARSSSQQDEPKNEQKDSGVSELRKSIVLRTSSASSFLTESGKAAMQSLQSVLAFSKKINPITLFELLSDNNAGEKAAAEEEQQQQHANYSVPDFIEPEVKAAAKRLSEDYKAALKKLSDIDHEGLAEYVEQCLAPIAQKAYNELYLISDIIFTQQWEQSVIFSTENASTGYDPDCNRSYSLSSNNLVYYNGIAERGYELTTDKKQIDELKNLLKENNSGFEKKLNTEDINKIKKITAIDPNDETLSSNSYYKLVKSEGDAEKIWEYPHNIVSTTGPLSEEGKKRGFYLYRNANRQTLNKKETIEAIIVHKKLSSHERLDLTKDINDSVSKKLNWPQENEQTTFPKELVALIEKKCEFIQKHCKLTVTTEKNQQTTYFIERLKTDKKEPLQLISFSGLRWVLTDPQPVKIKNSQTTNQANIYLSEGYLEPGDYFIKHDDTAYMMIISKTNSPELFNLNNLENNQQQEHLLKKIKFDDDRQIAFLPKKIERQLREKYEEILFKKKCIRQFHHSYNALASILMKSLHDNIKEKNLSEKKIKYNAMLSYLINEKFNNLISEPAKKDNTKKTETLRYYVLGSVTKEMFEFSSISKELEEETQQILPETQKAIHDAISNSMFPESGKITEKNITEVNERLRLIENRLLKCENSWLQWFFYKKPTKKIEAITKLNQNLKQEKEVEKVIQLIETCANEESIQQHRCGPLSCLQSLGLFNSKTQTTKDLKNLAKTIRDGDNYIKKHSRILEESFEPSSPRPCW